MGGSAAAHGAPGDSGADGLVVGDHLRGEQCLGNSEGVHQGSEVWAQFFAQLVDAAPDRLGTFGRDVPVHEEPRQVSFERAVDEQIAQLLQ